MMFVYGVTLSVFPHRAILTAAGIEPRTFGMLSQCLRGKECSIHQLLWVYIENFNMQKQKLALLNKPEVWDSHFIIHVFQGAFWVD